ncbi:FG-GAP-like repeat-containing protein [Rhodohalobacter sp. 8-1]|uniref:FG-GAP-like repeat-containing protein n=1 Tax=Rhodohalobacter sp. 8-1 TaxID=3131972 RepID=UPI0030EE286A
MISRIFILFLPLSILIFLTSCSTTPELQWNEEEGYRWAELTPNYYGDDGFEAKTSSDTGIDFSNSVSNDIIAENRHYANGSGVAIADVDNDGLADIYFASIEGRNRLYKNLGNLEFKDITDQAGVTHEGYNSTGVIFADLNGDSYPDLLITSSSDNNSIYLNDGSGNFSLHTKSGLGKSNGAHSAAIADVNGDNLPDLYIANYRVRSVRDLYGPEELSLENTTTTQNGQMQILPEFEDYYKVIEINGRQFRQEVGAYDELYINQGEGIFQKADSDIHFPVNAEGGPGLFKDWGFTPIFKDITGDGFPDLYVTNDFWTPDRLWINQGNGIFHAADNHAIINQSFSSMGVDMTDLNKDGETDIMVTEMLSDNHERRLRQYSDYMGEYQGSTHHNHNSVYLNRGDTTFAQINYLSGLEASEWSWATTFMDINLDGHDDLIVATGFYRDYLDMDAQRTINQRYQQMGSAMMEQGDEFLSFPKLEIPNKLFINNGDLTFTDRSSELGFTADDISMGMATGDLNNDGTLDLVFNRFNKNAIIYKNTTSKPRIAVRLQGRSPNTNAIGAKVTLRGGPTLQQHEITAGGYYLSGSDYLLTFAADESNENLVIEIHWRDGTTSRIENVVSNRIYEINQYDIEIIPSEHTVKKSKSPIFEDISDTINHIHHESDYNDFQRVQPLLPKELSRKGPAVAWVDFNNSGRDDLIVTEGKGGSLQVFENMGSSQFKSADVTAAMNEALGDQTALAGWASADGFTLAYGSSNYEQGNPGVPSAYLHTFQNGALALTDSIPGVLSSTGPIAAADYDNSGSVDLFVGGHFLPGGYPRDASSRLFKNTNGTFRLDEQNSAVLENAGLVNAALFADFSQNGKQDLLVSTEWGMLKLFENRDGRYREVTADVGFDQYSGWWNGIATGDFNNDGLIDIVAMNIGSNSPYKLNASYPLRLFYDDFNLNNRLDIVDAYYHEPVSAYVPRRQLLDFRSLPTILRNVQSHEEFSEAPIGKIFDLSISRVPYKEINTVHHLLFLNTGNGFETKQLPIEAQMSTGYHVGVLDYDNDGNEDLFISQNSFEYPSSVAKQDAGRGLLLKGDGTGSFEAISGIESGIKMYGEQRGAAFSDFNNDGKTDLAVSQNNGQTKLYVNKTEKAGIRVQLIGPDQNRSAIGSAIRLIYEDNTNGPVRTIQAGSGYRSQNSAIQVFGYAEIPQAIEVIWPDGSTSQTVFNPEQTTYIIHY